MRISVVALMVSDLDRAIGFYTHTLGWEKTMDAPMGDERWVTVAPRGEGATAFSLATNSQQTGRKAGGSTGVILEVDDVFDSYKKLSKAKVEFTEQPRNEPWGGWAMFKDSEGNVIGLHSPVPAGAAHH